MVRGGDSGLSRSPMCADTRDQVGVSQKREPRKAAKEAASPWPSWRDREVKRDHLYVLESSCGHIKIGRSEDVAQRLKGLLNACPPSIASIAVLTTIEDFGFHEYTLHEAMHEHRLRGEWFSAAAGAVIRAVMASGSLADYIVEIAAVQTAPRYQARNRRFARMREHIEREQKIADEREAMYAAYRAEKTAKKAAAKAKRDADPKPTCADGRGKYGDRWTAHRESKTRKPKTP